MQRVMQRVVIICEGQTEQEFCNKVLCYYLSPKQIFIQSPLIKRSNGGIVCWKELKKQIENTLKEDTSAYVSLLIDYYGIHKRHNFPKWEETLKIISIDKRIDGIEQNMLADIDNKVCHRFIPYMQLHEFEGLLFNNIDVFKRNFNADELTGLKELQEIFNNFQNPELINTTPENAPSKRLQRIIKGYDKIVYGNILAEAIGIQNIRSKCPRFNNWISKIENLK
jgi:hypothetical protein